MFAQITKGLSESIDKALAKHAPAQNLGQNLSHQNITKPAQNLARQASLAPQVQTQANTRQALTRFGNELAQNPQTKPTQAAVFDFDFIARDKTPELPKQTAQISPSSAQADNAITPPPFADGHAQNSLLRAEGDKGGGLFDLPSQAKQKDEALQNLQHTPAQSHTTQAQNLAPHTPQSQSLQARYDTLHDFANKMGERKESLSHEAKSLYDSFAKSLDSLSPESLSAKELNATDRHLSEYLVRTELAQVSNAKDIVLPYFSAKYQAKNEAELAQTFGSDKLAQMRQALQESKNTNPLAEFGTNYAEFYQDGKEAIAKLIAEANAAKQAGKDFNGQVAGAFSKEIDGAEASIDLVWGKITNAQTHEGYGLAHIIDKHPELDLSLIPQIIEKGKVESKNGIHSVILEQEGKEYRIGLGKGWKGNGENEWIITAYENKKIKENGETFYHDTFTTKEPLENLDNEIIQKSAQKIQEKMKVSKQYAENLAKWHKDSHPITKEADGTPKVFYHGAKVAKGKDIEIFDTKFSNGNYEHSQLKNLPFGFFFSSDLRTAKGYTYSDNKLVKKVFLKAKNPLVIDFEGKTYNQGIDDAISKMSQEFKQDTHDAIIYKNIIDDSEQDTTKKNKIANTIIVFDSNQIKAVGNKGTFEATNPNIYHSSSTAGGGVLGGTIAGVERDEEGNIIGFSPEKFALGFASGAAGAKALSKIANTKAAQNLANSKPAQNLASKASQNLANAKAITLSQKSIQKLATNPRAKAVLDKIKSKSDIIASQKITKGQENMKLDKFLDSNGKMSEEALRGYATPIPPLKFNSPNQLKAHFAEVNGKFGIVKTPYKDIEVDIPYAYRHFYRNTNNKNRNFIKGAFFETFSDPLFIAKDNSKGKESVYFYKPFLDKYDNFISLFGIGIDSEGKIEFKTFYKDTAGNRLNKMLRLDDENIIYTKNNPSMLS